jgi:small subunit ribosomal protein S4
VLPRRSAGRERNERRGLLADRVSIDEPLEPIGGQAVHSISRAEERAGDRGVRVGVATEGHDTAELGFCVSAADECLERQTGGEETEPLIGTVDRPSPARSVDEELELLTSLVVGHRFERGSSGVFCGLATGERCDGERDAEHRRPAAPVEMRERRKRWRELEQLVGPVRVGEPERRAVHDGPVPGRDLRTALLPDVPRDRRRVLARGDPTKHPARERPDVRWVGAEPLDVPPDQVVRVEPDPDGKAPHEVPRHRGVVGGRAGGPTPPGSVERRHRIRDRVRTKELERGAEGVPERETEATPDHALLELHRARGYPCPATPRCRSCGRLVGWLTAMDKIGPRHKMCRRVGQPLCGRPNCPAIKRPYPPGQHGRGRKRFSEYQVRLLEKQKLRAIYGVGERQMRAYYDKASRLSGVTGEEMIRQLETRLDAVIQRLGFALSQRQARQLVSHGHVKVDGRRLNVPSAQVKPEQTIELSDKAKNFVYVHEALELTPDPPPYLYRNKDQFQGTLSRYPERAEIPLPVPIDERLIIEFYS